MATVCVIGDCHGHVQLALCVAARWQKSLQIEFDAVFLCGDVGTFTSDEELDSTTRRHSRSNPCELEFLYQWSAQPQAPWIARLFKPGGTDGLGLICPVIMIHGNHEGFINLARITPSQIPSEPVEPSVLPTVDSGGYIRYLPSGWRCRTASGLIVAGVGGIERGQRYADYHDLAFIDGNAILHLLGQQRVDFLITHQGPSEIQGHDKGSKLLQVLLDEEKASIWFHGHSIRNPDIQRAGPNASTLVVPLSDIAFPCKGPFPDDPDPDEMGWSTFNTDNEQVCRMRPPFWRLYRRSRWNKVGDTLVCPDLKALI